MVRSARDRGHGAARAWFALSLVRALTPREAHRLVAELGTPDAVLGASPAHLGRAGVRREVAHEIAAVGSMVDGEERARAAVGARIVAWCDGDYPAGLRAIADPPLALAVRGTLLSADDVAIAVVGARRASAYGCRVARELALGLAQAGVVVVSGLAAGIDAAAHRGALEGGGRTIAVLGTGIDRIYPAWHAELARAVAGAGALCSEFPCGTPPLAQNFPRRNRVISGISVGTVVVEAAARSGSLITARCALEQGREVFAVPGPIGRAEHRGAHALIQQGAKLVNGVDDILAEIGPALLGRLASHRAAAVEATLTPLERCVLEAVGGSGHVDDVMRRARVPAGPLLETLLALELRGLVEQVPGKRFRRSVAA